MVFLGILLLFGVLGLAFAAAWANQDAVQGSAGTFDLLGRSVTFTHGGVFLIGAVAGALTLLAVYMIMGGTRRRMSRSAQPRRALRERERELQAREAEASRVVAADRAGAHEAGARDADRAAAGRAESEDLTHR
jgi:hypothetical protein